MESFVNRQKELRILDDRYGSGKAEFLVVTGRRRVGKTSVLAQLRANIRESIFWVI
ncbi:MAG: ATP-binding protein [Caldilineaceae bacterium]